MAGRLLDRGGGHLRKLHRHDLSGAQRHPHCTGRGAALRVESGSATIDLMLQISRSSPVYDVVIIGSGAGGGTVTKVLADLGISVTLLEAGPMLNPAKDFKEHVWPYQVPHRGSMEGGASYFGRGRAFGYFSAHAGGWELDGEPYTMAPGSKFRWFRSRIVGGRTNHYGRI